MNKILLIYPSFDSSNPMSDVDPEVNLENKVVPMGIISIAAYLEKAGYEVKIIDGRFHKKVNILERLSEEINSCDCVGFSVMTTQVGHALQLADSIRKVNKDIPIVWGGIHPTLFPEQTCQDDAVDYLIKGEGEYAFVDLLSYLKTGYPKLNEIKGLVCEKMGVVQTNAPTEPLDVTKLPRPAYHLLDIEKYIKRKLLNGRVVRGLDILTSRGCPYRCAFCVNPFLTSCKWRAISIERVLENIQYLVSKYNLDSLWFMDDFFFGNKDRVKKITENIIRENYNIVWEANIRSDNFSDKRINDEFLKLLKESGCYALRIGMESGSNRVLKLLKKDITVSQTINAVRQCGKYDILPVGFFMMGVPGESLIEIKKTLSFLWQLRQINPKGIYYPPGIYRPYPGGELYKKSKKLGFKEPAAVREWATQDLYAGYLNAKSLPWLKKARLLEDFRLYGSWLPKRRGSGKLVKKIFGKMAEWRYEYGHWGFRFEPLFYKTVLFICKVFIKSFGKHRRDKSLVL